MSGAARRRGRSRALFASIAILAATATAGADFSGRVPIGSGRGLHLECRGAGGPTVILISGHRTRADGWSAPTASGGEAVLPAVSRRTQACAYDRPGTSGGGGAPSRSDPVPMPRSAGEAAAELHELLTAAAIPRPYVLVGHSMGGLIARLHARAHPGAVAGLVLVDAIPETMQSGMKPRQFARYERRYLTDVPPALAGYEDLETIDFRRSFAQMRSAPQPRRALPAVVLSKGRPWRMAAGVSRGFAALVDRVWTRGQDHLARLFAGDPHWVAARSGHLIHSEQPGLVTRAIARVLRLARRPGSA